MERTKWIDRTFVFDFPEGWIYNILERLRGTEIRLKAISQGLVPSQLTKKPGDQWSVQEHIGHLLDLEELHEGRIDDFLARKEILRPADMSNKKTYGAGHQQRNVAGIINEFSIARNRFIRRMEELDDETQRFRSEHPRLKTAMRPVDMAYFTAEHDDHHLSSIRALIKQL